jgi:phosphoglycerate dehydrogenase-like enzyme
MPKVLLIDPALATMAGRFREILPADVEVVTVATFDDAEFARLAADADVLVNARRRIDAPALATASRVRFVQLVGVGCDTVDVEAARAAGVLAAYNPGVNTAGVAEHALMLMLALIKRLPSSERVTRGGRFAPGELIAGGIDDLDGATVGLIGFGAIGRAVAARLVPFGAHVVYSTRRQATADVEASLGARWLPLEELLASSAVVSLHLPLTAPTYHLIGPAELAAMPVGSFLVNTARGGLVDEDTLRRAVEGGHLAGAALDVLEHETDGGNPFADLPQVIVTPHLGGGSRGSFARMAERSAANVGRFLAGEPVHDPVPGLAAPEHRPPPDEEPGERRRELSDNAREPTLDR